MLKLAKELILRQKKDSLLKLAKELILRQKKDSLLPLARGMALEANLLSQVRNKSLEEEEDTEVRAGKGFLV